MNTNPFPLIAAALAFAALWMPTLSSQAATAAPAASSFCGELA